MFGKSKGKEELAEEKQAKKAEKEKHKVGVGTMLAWTSRGMSVSINVVLIMSLTLYCTNALGLNIAVVSSLLAASKIIDSVTDLVAGYIVDRTKTKLGKGRPYELCVIGLWLMTWLCFAVPEGVSTTVKYIWVIVAYICSQSIFYTLLNANQTAYMVRAFNDDKKYASLSSIGGLLTTFAVIIFNIVYPMQQNKILNSAPGWARLVGMVAVPMAILGIMRFIFIPEKYQVDTATSEMKITDVITLLKANKNVWILILHKIIGTIAGGLGVGAYYYLYVIENYSIMGLMSMFSIFSMLTMVFYPKLLNKISVKRLIQITSLFTVVSGPLMFISGKNLAGVAVATVLAGCSTLPGSYMAPLLIVDCADYNEWKGMPRMEGTLGAVIGFAGKVGGALSTLILGILLNAAGFVSDAQTQSASAIAMIKFLQCFLPAIFGILGALVLNFFVLDKLKPQIQADLEKKHAAINQETE